MPAHWEDRRRPAHRRKDSVRTRWWKWWFRRRDYPRLVAELESARLLIRAQHDEMVQLRLRAAVSARRAEVACAAEQVALSKAQVAARRLAEATEARLWAEKVAFGGQP